MKNIPDNISKLLKLGMMNWSFDQMTEFSCWQNKENVFSDSPVECREPEELPCFWERRGLSCKI